VDTIESLANKNKEFRIKPGLNIKKRNEDRSLVFESSGTREEEKNDDINYKPKRFQKILSQRKDKESLW